MKSEPVGLAFKPTAPNPLSGLPARKKPQEGDPSKKDKNEKK